MSTAFISHPMLSACPHGFFGRQGGVSTGIYASLNVGLSSNDAPEAVMQNRCLVTSALERPDAVLLTPRQVHGIVVVRPEDFANGVIPEGDAIVTNMSGSVIGVQTADCAPVLFYDPIAGVVGAAHAGWRGAVAGVLGATVQAMLRLGSRTENIIAVIGPCIHPASYQVDEPFYKQVLQVSRAYQAFFTDDDQTPGCHRFDLPRFCTFLLYNAGITHVADVQQDTLTQPDVYFSFRRATLEGQKNYGRQVSVITLP
ncbi:MAG: peptidoglycan editing factor PgeF [Holosporales bacterium]|jgi:YfiH family protein